MRKFFVLLKVSLQSMLLSSTNYRGRSKKKAATGLSAVFIIGFMGLYLSGFYSYMLMKVLAPLNMEVLVFLFMGMAVLVGGLLFTTFAVKGVVFGGKDNDLLLSMPVPTTLLMASRVTAIYLENLLISIFVLVPAGIICTFMTQRGVGHSLLFWIRLGIAVLFLPLLDTALSVLLGALAAFLSARVSRGALGQNIVIGIFMAAVFYFSFNINNFLKNLADNVAGVKNSLTWAAPVFATQSVENNYRLSAQSASGQKKALLKKEMQRFFGTPMYFWNAGMGLIMLLASGAAALVMREKLMIYVEMAGDHLPLSAAAVIYYWGSIINGWIGLALPIALFTLFAAVCTIILIRKGPAMLRKL